MIQPMQHCQESQSIEVMNDTMAKSQSASIVNCIRMQWTKVIAIVKNITIQEFQQCEESQLIEGM
jgi:hypothetical protein